MTETQKFVANGQCSNVQCSNVKCSNVKCLQLKCFKIKCLRKTNLEMKCQNTNITREMRA